MFITEIFFNGISLDLYPSKKMKFNIQVNDIAEVKNRQATYTNSYKIPKTAHNVQTLGGLGIPSDTSPYPYQKPDCMVCIDGIPMMVRGWINIKSTDNEYNIYLYSGIIDFFKAVENKTLGADLDLSEINHNKNLQTVINSFLNPAYRYLITDYNGLTHFGINGDTINIDYLVPSVNAKYLWDKIHTTYGFTYSGILFDDPNFTNLWITYPKPINVDTGILEKEVNGVQNIQHVNVSTQNPNNFYRQLIAVGLDNNMSYTVPTSGNYQIVFEADIFSGSNKPEDTFFYYASVNQEAVPFSQRNAVTLGSFPRVSQHVKTQTNIYLNAGDVISFYSFLWMSNGFVKWQTNFNLKLLRFAGSEVSFTTELSAFKITDFVKEILNVFGLTAFPDPDLNHIDYRLMSERVLTAETVDWTDKFIRRTDERYIYNSFAQRNEFKYQYNDKEGDYNDGAIVVNNLNLKESDEVYRSKMYSPDKELRPFYFGSAGLKSMGVFRLYEKEIKEENGSQKITYKNLDKRFHFVRSNSLTTTVEIGSASQGISQTVNSVAFADFSKLTWSNVLNIFYGQYGKILNASRLHEIEVYLHPLDAIQVDLKKLYYFAQEQQYYILNKMTFDGSESTKCEFVRVRREGTEAILPTEPVDPADYSLSIVWTADNTTNDLSGVADGQSMSVGAESFPASNPVISKEWQKDNGSGYVGLGIGGNPYNGLLTIGVNKFRIKAVAQDGYTFFSNELSYEKIAVTCRLYEVSKYLNSQKFLQIFYTDCQYQDQYIYVQGADPGFTEYRSFCAKEDSVLSNGNITLLGNC